jgi:hypothetical protein
MVRVIVLNATFNNISVILWRSVLFVEETRVPRENHRPAASHWQTLSYNVVSSTPHHELYEEMNLGGRSSTQSIAPQTKESQMLLRRGRLKV